MVELDIPKGVELISIRVVRGVDTFLVEVLVLKGVGMGDMPLVIRLEVMKLMHGIGKRDQKERKTTKGCFFSNWHFRLD
jgi:hypothetical protein